MTTPRVTVPVEDLRELIDASSEVRDLLAKVPEMQGREYVGTGNRFVNAIGAAQRSYLSAAPAPEGGAVEDLREALIQADLKIRSLPGTDQSDVEFIREALATREEALAEAGEIDLYDDKVQAGIAWTMRQWGETLGLKTWDMGDGSESVEGDVGAEIHTILVDAGLRDPETNEMAALRAQPPAREDAQPVRCDHEAYQGYCAHCGVKIVNGLAVTPATPPAPEAEKMRLDAEVVETAIGGAYDLPDGRGFWIDAVAAREMTKRVLAALQQEGRS